MDRPGRNLNPQTNVHSDPIVRSSKSSSSGEEVAENANTNAREVSSAPSKIDKDRGIANTAANSQKGTGRPTPRGAVHYIQCGLVASAVLTTNISLFTAFISTQA